MRLGAVFVAAACLHAQVLTSQYTNERTSATLAEKVLTPETVNASRFGKLFTFAVDGDVYAQPLVVAGVSIPGKGVHDVVFVATEHDSVYAFDAAGRPAEPLWRVNFLDQQPGATTVPASAAACPFISPEIGITPTPVIDASSGTLYVVARTAQRDGLIWHKYEQKLHALAITTGAEKFGGPVVIDGPGFDPLRELPRAGLLLADHQIYVTWASSCDVGPYHGWVMTYDARTLKQTAAFNTSPDADQSGIWQSDNAPPVDEAGNVYVVTGNGKFDAAGGGRDYGDSVLKLRLAGGRLSVQDRYTPPNQEYLNANDLDLGSGGAVLIPPQAGNPTPLLVTGGKDRNLYVLDRDHLSRPPQILAMGGGVYGAAAYWNGHVFVLASNDVLKDFGIANGKLTPAPAARGTHIFSNPGATPAVSANGTRGGIVWVIETKVWNAFTSTKPEVLYAYDASNVAHELYNSQQNASRDQAGQAIRFTVPTVAAGRVYIGAKREVDVYGLLAGER